MAGPWLQLGQLVAACLAIAALWVVVIVVARFVLDSRPERTAGRAADTAPAPLPGEGGGPTDPRRPDFPDPPEADRPAAVASGLDAILIRPARFTHSRPAGSHRE